MRIHNLYLRKHALCIVKYSEKRGRNALAQITENRRKHKKAHTILSIYLSLKDEVTVIKFVISPKISSKILWLGR
jgi:hypothetical protein